MQGGTALRVAVFVDWQNAYKTAREAFGIRNMPNEHGNFSPYQLARLLAAGNGRGSEGGELVRVELHRGLPSQKHDQRGYAANRRQSAAWMKRITKSLSRGYARYVIPADIPRSPRRERRRRPIGGGDCGMGDYRQMRRGDRLFPRHGPSSGLGTNHTAERANPCRDRFLVEPHVQFPPATAASGRPSSLDYRAGISSDRDTN